MDYQILNDKKGFLNNTIVELCLRFSKKQCRLGNSKNTIENFVNSLLQVHSKYAGLLSVPVII